jgi:hypothetical protein
MGTQLKLGSFAEYTGQLLGLLRVQHILYRHFLNNDKCAQELTCTQVTTIGYCVTSQLYSHPVQGNACNDDHVETFVSNKHFELAELLSGLLNGLQLVRESKNPPVLSCPHTPDSIPQPHDSIMLCHEITIFGPLPYLRKHS